VDTDDPCKVHIETVDPNPSLPSADTTIHLEVVGTAGISCNKNAIKLVEVIDEMKIKHDLE